MMKRLTSSVCRAASSALFWAALAMPAWSQDSACPSQPEIFAPPEAQLLAQLAEAPEPLLAAMDSYSVAMEACYDSALGPLDMAKFAQQSQALADKIGRLRDLAEAEVRGDEFAFEDLLSSDQWRHIESLRVASAYGAAWGKLSSAVRNISAHDKRDALRAARATLQKLTFEFKHPVLVQRAMYALAVAEIENGGVDAARDTLARLLSSLKRNGNPPFQAAVQAFYDEISAPGYQPPLPPETIIDDDVDGQSSLTFAASGDVGQQSVEAALQAVAALRPPEDIAEILAPAFQAGPESLRQALDLVSRDLSLQQALDYQPGPSLRQMRNGFRTQRYALVREAWRGLKPYYPYMPPRLKRQIDYQMGVAMVSLGELKRAIGHLKAARQGLAAGAEAKRIDQLIVLARLTSDQAPDAALVELAKGYQEIPPKVQGQPHGIEYALAMRSRIVLSRDAANRKKWKTADDLLAGFGPDAPAYQLLLGTRVQLLARAVAHSAEKGRSAKVRNSYARGGFVIYGLWLTSTCPPGCLTGDRLAVHRAAIDLALKGGLASPKFGEAWGTFEAEGGDTRPLVPAALEYLLAQADSDRLVSVLNPADEGRAAYVLSHWKTLLADADTRAAMPTLYDFLNREMDELQGRPRAALLEALIEFDLSQAAGDAALAHADELAKAFPRRPNAWFLRAAALQATGRDLEAARALSSLARRTPADDPVGMGARIGLAAIFIDLEKAETACAMRAKTLSRPNAADNWQTALGVFPRLKDWDQASRARCAAS